MPGGVLLGVFVLAGFAIWSAVLFWRGRIIDKVPRHETRHERRRLQHKG